MCDTPKRRLKRLDVEFISLVDKGANKKRIVYKSENADTPNIEKVIEIKKTDEDQHLVYGIVYSPDEVDTQGDITTAGVIKEAAYNFMKSARTNNVDKQHNFEAGDGFVAESWITKANDSVFPTDPVGSWAVAIKVEKEETWELVKSGEITGLSLAGSALTEEAKTKKSLANKAKELFENLKKDFNENMKQREMWDYIGALSNSLYQCLEDEAVTDKKSAILENVAQFVTAINSTELLKAGKTISAKTLSKLKSAVTELQTLITIAEEQSKINKNGEDEMKPEEIQALVTKAVEDAVKPLTEKITALEKAQTENSEAVTKSQKEITDRLEVVEKAAPGSKQKEPGSVQKEADEDGKSSIWF